MSKTPDDKSSAAPNSRIGPDIALDHNPTPAIPGRDAYPIATTNSELDRDTLLDAFVFVLNLCEPSHPRIHGPYPVDQSDVDYGYNKASSSTWAACGPRYYTDPTDVGFSVDKQYFQNRSLERLLAVLVHEVTHVTEGSHSQGSIHNNVFWETMAFNAHHLLDAWDEVTTAFPSCSKYQFLEECVLDPNRSMTDRRSESVTERRRTQAALLGVTPTEEPYRDSMRVSGIEET